jgi:hypothetical protein
MRKAKITFWPFSARDLEISLGLIQGRYDTTVEMFVL